MTFTCHHCGETFDTDPDWTETEAFCEERRADPKGIVILCDDCHDMVMQAMLSRGFDPRQGDR